MTQNGIQPNIVTYNSLLAGNITNKHFAEANQVLVEMKENGLEPDAFTFISLIRLTEKVS